MDRLTLVLGGARSGKSAYAEALAAEAGEQVLYLATAEACDDETAERIRRHQQRRPKAWLTIEAPLEPVAALRARETPSDAIILDSVSTWLSNLLLRQSPEVGDAPSGLADGAEAEVLEALQELTDWRRSQRANLVLVSDEVGMSVVPSFPLGRTYRDLLGTANQVLAAEAQQVFLLVAGLPLQLKGRPERGDPPATQAHNDSD